MPAPEQPRDGNLFFGIWPDHTTRKYIHALGPQYAHAGHRAHVDDLHMTLLFAGRVDAAMQACLTRAARELARTCPPFTVTLDCIGHWQRSRITWLAPTNPPGALYELVFALREAAVECGLKPEHRPYSPHVTLYRRAAPTAQGPVDPITLRAERFLLAASRPGVEPCYKQLEEFMLAGTESA